MLCIIPVPKPAVVAPTMVDDLALAREVSEAFLLFLSNLATNPGLPLFSAYLLYINVVADTFIQPSA